jgi:hypothetical protein
MSSVWPRIKDLRVTLIAAGIITFFLCQRHAGFRIYLQVFILIPWIIGSAWKIIVNPKIRWLQTAKILIWLLSVAIITGSHYFLASRTRARAQEIVNAIAAYHATHGVYPESGYLESIGYTKDKIRSMVGMGGYLIENDKPSFFYASTYIIFETDSYNFNTRQWEHRN